jgi:hypothetical protein
LKNRYQVINGFKSLKGLVSYVNENDYVLVTVEKQPYMATWHAVVFKSVISDDSPLKRDSSRPRLAKRLEVFDNDDLECEVKGCATEWEISFKSCGHRLCNYHGYADSCIICYPENFSASGGS